MGRTRLGGDFRVFGEIPKPANPSPNFGEIYCRDLLGVTTLFFLDSAGTETDLLVGGTGGITSINGDATAAQTLTEQANKILIADDLSGDHAFTLGTDVVTIDKSNVFGDFNQIFKDNRLLINNPADSFAYTFVAAAIGASHNLNLPLLVAADTIAVLALAQAFTNKTIDADLNTITNIESADLKAAAGILTTQLADATNFVLINQANIFGDFDQTFKDDRIVIESPDGLTPTTIANLQQTLARTLSIPILTADRNFVVTGEASQITLGTEVTGASTDLSDSANLARNTDNLGFFAATTSLQLLGVISDETGTGLLVFNNTPTILTPTIASFVNAAHSHLNAAGGGQLDSTLALSDTADIAYLNTANVYIAGNRQDFLGLLAGTAGLNVGGIAGNPTTQVNGDIWLNTSTNQIFGRISGVDVDLGAGAGGGEANTISSLGGGTVLTAAVPKSGVDLRTVSIATTAPIAHSTTADLMTFTLNGLVNADLSGSAGITFANLQNIATARLLGRQTAATGAIEEISLNATLELVAATTLQRAALTGDVTASAGSNATVVANVPDGALSANVVLINQTNTYGAFAQIFPSTQLQLQSNGNEYIFTGSAIIADRAVTIPLLTGPDTFVFEAFGATLTNKTIDLDSNTITGTTGEFNTALQADSFFFVSQNISNMATSTAAQFDVACSDDDFFFISDNISAMATSTIAQFNAACSDGTFAYIGVSNAWGAVNQNIAATGKWQEAGVNISPIGLHDIYMDGGAFAPIDSGGLVKRTMSTGTNQKGIIVSAFSASADQYAVTKVTVPENYDGGIITVVISWTNDTTGTGNVLWEVAAVNVSDADALDGAGTNFGTGVQLTADAGTTLNLEHKTARSENITPANTYVAGDTMYIRVGRLGSNGSDTFDQTSDLLGISVRFGIDAAVAA